MEFCITISLVVIQILSLTCCNEIFEKFEEITAAGQFFPPQLSESNYPACEFFLPRNVKNRLKFNYINQTDTPVPAMRIVGEYRILKIICTASFPIDFQYYGVVPTEAITIDWHKTLEHNDKSNLKFTVEVKVYSVLELFEFFKNPNNSYYDKSEKFVPPKVAQNYSRTGRYEFNGIFNKSLATSFYLFLEDNAQPSFLRNNKTVPNIEGNNFILPCVSSHFETDVQFTKIPSKDILSSIKSPTKGFIFESHEDIIVDKYNGKYTCVLIYKGIEVDSIHFEFSNSTSIAGALRQQAKGTLNHLQTLKDGGDIDISGFPIRNKRDFAKFIRPFCRTKGPTDPVDVEKLKLISVPSHNFGYMRLVQQFALPEYVDRSYTARTVNRSMVGWDPLKKFIMQPVGTLLAGTSYCTTGYSDKIVDFGSTIRGFVIVFDYGKDWATIDRNTSDIDNHFGLEILNKSSPLYANSIISFACRINTVVVVKPVIWHTERINGTKVQERVDYDFVGDTSIWNAILSKDVNKVICEGSYWYSALWREISINVTLQELITTTPTTTEMPTTTPTTTEMPTTTPTTTEMPTTTPTTTEMPTTTPTTTEMPTTTPTTTEMPTTTPTTTEMPTTTPTTTEMPTTTVMPTTAEMPASTALPTTTATPMTTTRPIIDLKSDDFNIMVVVIPLLVFMVTAMAAAVYIKCYRLVKTGLTQDEIDKFSKGMNIEQIPEKDKKYAHGFTSITSYKTEYEISPERFVVYEDNVLGSGAFGVVTMGLIDNKPVAVKTVQKNAEKQYLKALLSELKIMIYLGCHPNLVQMIGAYTKDLNKGIVYVFVEYAAFGNMESYLRNSKDLTKLPAINNGLPIASDGYVTSYMLCDQNYEYKNSTFLTVHNLLLWSKQIVNGMEYLGSKNVTQNIPYISKQDVFQVLNNNDSMQVIHGDLATRNVLLDENLNAKITDFGLSRQLYGYQNYIKKHQAPLPWRWMALESLKFLNFSTASDVWAFGITLWEIFSLGQLPYSGYSIIRQCWHKNPKKRPVFKVLKQQLDDIIFHDEIPV